MRILLRNSRNVLVAGGLLLGLTGAAQAQATIRRVYPTNSAGRDSLLQLGSTITLDVSGLRVGAGGALPARDLTLYLNEIPLRGLAPLAISTVADATAPASLPPGPASLAASADSAGGNWTAAAPASASTPNTNVLTRVVFVLRHDAAPGYWTLADGPPWQAAHAVRLGLGSPNQLLTAPNAGRAGTVQLAPAPGWPIGLALTGLAGILLLVAAARSWLLRAPVTDATDADGYPLSVADAAPPYSLARVQLAWWSFLVLGGGLVSGSVMGTLPALPPATLALLGVSMGTAALAGLAPTRPDHAPDQPPQTRGWLPDLLCDVRGLAMHRLQFVLVSLGVGSALVWTVYATGVLPGWPLAPAWLLAFSSLAYLGPKWRRASLVPATSPTPVPTAVAWPVPGPGWPAPSGPPAPAFGSSATPAPATPAWPAAGTEPTPDNRAAAPAPMPASQPVSLVSAAPLPTEPVRPPEPAPAISSPPLVAAPVSAVALVPVAVVAATPLTAPGPEADFATRSRADLATGEVLYHEEDDMGPLEEDDMGPLEENEYSGWPVGG